MLEFGRHSDKIKETTIKETEEGKYIFKVESKSKEIEYQQKLTHYYATN